MIRTDHLWPGATASAKGTLEEDDIWSMRFLPAHGGESTAHLGLFGILSTPALDIRKEHND